MGNRMWSAATLAAAPVIVALLACAEGGANPNQKGVGDQPGGVQLGIGDIAVSPVGNYVLFRSDDDLAVGWVNSGKIETLPVSDPSRLAFSKKQPIVYVGDSARDRLVAVDVSATKVLWETAVDDASTKAMRIESAVNDAYVLVADLDQVTVFDAASGSSKGSYRFERGVVDVEILPDSKRALVAESHVWEDETVMTHMTVIELESGKTTEFDVPNCAADFVVSSDGNSAYMAPTQCSKDPVSLIHLDAGKERFGKNLPGFGPVARADDGKLAVAFYDRTQGEEALFDDPSIMPDDDTAQYHLMLIDTATLKYDFVEVGDNLPRYAITPDGNVLVVDSSLSGDTARMLDVAKRQFVDLKGPDVKLDEFTMSSDSKHAYVLQNDVFDLDLDAARANRFGLDFTPRNINISADDKTLFLRLDDTEICIYDIAERSCRNRFVTAVP